MPWLRTSLAKTRLWPGCASSGGSTCRASPSPTPPFWAASSTRGRCFWPIWRRSSPTSRSPTSWPRSRGTRRPGARSPRRCRLPSGATARPRRNGARATATPPSSRPSRPSRRGDPSSSTRPRDRRPWRRWPASSRTPRPPARACSTCPAGRRPPGRSSTKWGASAWATSSWTSPIWRASPTACARACGCAPAKPTKPTSWNCAPTWSEPAVSSPNTSLPCTKWIPGGTSPSSRCWSAWPF